jgi:hypothetical protein
LAPSITTRTGLVTSSPRFAQPSQQVGDDRGVLGRALGQPERDLGPIQGDAEGDHAAVLGDVHAVDHERDQVQPGQVLGEQLGQGMLGRGHEPARHRRLRRARAGLLDPAADRLQPGGVVARRQLGQHPLQGQLVQQLGPGERRPGRQAQLAGAVGGAHPRTVDPHTPAAKGDLAGLGAVADRGTVGVVAALGPTSPSTSAASSSPSTPRPVPTASASSPSLAAPASSASAIVTCSGSTNPASAGRVGCVCLAMWRSPSVERLGGCPTPTTRQASGGDRHLKFHDVRDNLGARGECEAQDRVEVAGTGMGRSR